MMIMLTPANFEKYLNQINDVPLFVVYGEERFFYDRIMEMIENWVFKSKSEKSLNYHVFYGMESDESEILSTCLSYPMLAEHKLVTVKEFDKLRIYDKESFLKYIDHPQPSTILLLMAEHWGDSHFHKKIIERSVVVKCKPLFENQLYDWVNKRFLDHHISINREVIQFLIENIGQNLLNLNSEIEKIVNYIGKGESVELNEIAQLIGFSKDVNIFYFQRVLAEKNKVESLKTGLRLLEQGESLAAILPMLFNFFRKIWVVKYLQLKKYTKGKILQAVKGNQNSYSVIFSTANNFSQENLEYIMELIENAEIELKTTQRSTYSILTMLCYNICNKKKEMGKI